MKLLDRSPGRGPSAAEAAEAHGPRQPDAAGAAAAAGSPRGDSAPTRVPLLGPAPAAPPEGLASPADWPLVAVGSQPICLATGFDPPAGGSCSVRVTVGIDVRRPVRVRVRDAAGGATLVDLDLSFASALQPVDAALPAGARPARILLHATDEPPVYLLHAGVPHAALRPHLLAGGVAGSTTAFLDHLRSAASLTQYGWNAGCVLDALADFADAGVAAAAAALDLHLDHWFPGGGLRCEDFRSVRRTQVGGTETCNVFAGLARRRPDHPVLDRALAFFAERRGADGIIRDGAVVAEHNTTVAYPLAVIAASRGREDLLDEAVAQLRVRRLHLDRPDGLYLRHHEDGRRTFRNWGRGVTWYLLGLVRTLGVLDDAGHPLPEDLVNDLPRLARWVRSLQRDDGLWSCFLDEPQTGAETSGSAGIAAALAIAAGRGWIEPDHADAARRCADALRAFLLPDGLLTGMSPGNKAEAGPAVQRSGQRTAGGACAGLFGQLLHALEEASSLAPLPPPRPMISVPPAPCRSPVSPRPAPLMLMRRLLPRLSFLAALAVASQPLAASAQADALRTIEVRVSPERRSTLQGFGTGLNRGTYGEFDQLPSAKQDELNDKLWSETGFNAIRIWLMVDKYAPEPGRRDLNEGFDKPYLNLVRQAMERGVTELMVTPTDVPGYLKEKREVADDKNRSREHPVLRPDAHEEHAAILADFAAALRDEHGIAVDALSLQNEPNAPHGRAVYFNGELMVKSVKALRAALDERGLSEVLVIAPETASADWVAEEMLQKLKNDPAAWAATGGISTHSYNMAATGKMWSFTDGGTKTFWQGESSVPGKEEPGDAKRAATLASRFLSDMNHGVTHWFHFIGFMQEDPRDNGTRILMYKPGERGDGWLTVYTKYHYFKQLADAFDYGAAFRRPTSSMDKSMVWSYGRKPRVTVAAAENPDGTWAVGLSNYTHTPVSEDARDFYKQNAGYPTEAFEVDLGIDELSGAGTVEFAVTRSGPDGGDVLEAEDAGTVTMRDGRLKVTIAPLQLVTLRSVAPIE